MTERLNVSCLECDNLYHKEKELTARLSEKIAKALDRIDLECTNCESENVCSACPADILRKILSE